MVRMCAWCEKILGEIEPKDNHETTHGICKECADKLDKEDAEEEEMGSLKPYPAITNPVLNPVFAATFNQMYGEPIPKKEDNPKDKKGGKDEKV